ncbi:hypothetical protein E2C01_069165 [Portunus trituberculatus]|uniref:Uncharacterized protein n=1 Tax=Portunus trituberculatus TaxID=210409 RepID=A0A5B7HPD1_PORTR|nr:hypothetical protein [Portunus trituberculatus]
MQMTRAADVGVKEEANAIPHRDLEIRKGGILTIRNLRIGFKGGGIVGLSSAPLHPRVFRQRCAIAIKIRNCSSHARPRLCLPIDRAPLLT